MACQLMTAIAFDTLKFAKRLKEGGFTEQQAEALATAKAELIEDNLATRRHLKELEAQSSGISRNWRPRSGEISKNSTPRLNRSGPCSSAISKNSAPTSNATSRNLRPECLPRNEGPRVPHDD